MALAKPGKIVSVEPSFVMYKMICGFLWHAIHRHCRCGKKIFRWISKRCWQALSVNNRRWCSSPIPTIQQATIFAASDIERVLQVAPGVVVVDEAYHAFARDSFRRVCRNIAIYW